jgi:hypothetical protein
MTMTGLITYIGMVWKEGKFIKKKSFLLRYRMLDTNIEYLSHERWIYKKRIKKR